MAGEPPEGVDMEHAKEEEQTPKGHASLLRQAVNNRQADDARFRPGVKAPTAKTPPPLRSQSLSGEGARTPSPKMRSFRAATQSKGQREISPAPNLADLEFPPPPPPLEDDQASSELSHDSIDGRPKASQTKEEKTDDPFVLGEEVNVEENSLKKNLERATASPNTTASTNSVLATSKSADSLSSGELLDTRNGGEHLHAPGEAPGSIMSQSIFGILRTPSPWDDHSNDPPPEPAPSAPLKKPTTPRLRQVEAPESKESKLSSSMESVTGQNPPSVQSVSELFESLRLKAGKKPGSTNETQTESDAHSKPVSTLTRPSKKEPEVKKEDDEQAGKFDFKSRLRKVAQDKPAETEPGATQVAAPPAKPSAAPERSDRTESSEEADEAKRKSSGSINSLKKMWEKEQQAKAMRSSDSHPVTKPPPPPQPDKPAVPVKPSAIKPPKSSSAAIYATPTASVINSKPPVASRTTGVYAKGASVPSSDEASGDRQKILSLCSEAEQVLSQSGSTPTQWMDLLASVHSLCHTYADSIAPHGRFHFRQLIAKLETQTKEMKQASGGPLRNSSEHSRLVGDVKNTIRDLTNALQR